MKKFLLIIFSSLALAACSHTPEQTSFKESEMYQGYPCADYCKEFQQGYELAMNTQITDETGCVEGSLDVVTGCKAYVSDYRFDHEEQDLYF